MAESTSMIWGWSKNVRPVKSYSMLTLILLLPFVLLAGEWHVGASLQCGQCHVEHGTAGGQPIPGGPYSTLLQKGSVNELCLSCHDGSDPTAPDVLAPVTMYGQAPSNESAAGHLLTIGVPNPGGHALGVSTITPLNSTGRTITVTCASCHDYHGNSNYRNLRYDPNGVGDSINIVAGVDVFWLNAPANPPTTAGSVAAYNHGNIGYKSSWSRWCGACHDQVATNSVAVLPAHFNGHPGEVSFLSGGSSSHADVTHWIAGTGEGFVGNTVVVGEGIPRLPFLQPTAIDFASTQQVQSSNVMSCISCHKSHGSDFGKSLRWPYVEGGVNYISGCQQCHHK